MYHLDMSHRDEKNAISDGRAGAGGFEGEPTTVHVEVDPDSDVLGQLMDVLAEQGWAFDRAALEAEGWSWSRGADGAKNALVLTDGLRVKVLPTGGPGPTLVAPIAEDESIMVLVDVPAEASGGDPVEEDVAWELAEAAADRSGYELVMRTQDAARCLIMELEDGPGRTVHMGVPVRMVAYHGVRLLVTDGMPFKALGPGVGQREIDRRLERPRREARLAERRRRKLARRAARC